MKLKQYIDEGRSVGMSQSRAENFMEKNCQQSLKGTRIYRGIENHSKDYYYINPKQHEERTSPFADHNYYNMLLSELPSWKKYPPRNKSLICTTDFYNAKHRSSYNPFYVFPKDGTPIGVCPTSDIWQSFEDAGISSMNNFNTHLDDFIFKNVYQDMHNEKGSLKAALNSIKDIIGIVPMHDTDINYQTFIKASQTIDELKKRDVDLFGNTTFRYGGWLRDFSEWDGTFIDFLDDLLDPDKNGFRLVKIGSTIPGGREVWMDGESVLVSTDIDLNLTKG